MQVATCSLFPHTGEREGDLFGISSSSCKDTNSIMRPHPLGPHPTLITSQRPPSSNTATLGLRCISLEGMQTPGQGPLCIRSSPWLGGDVTCALFMVRYAWTKLCAKDYLRTAAAAAAAAAKSPQSCPTLCDPIRQPTRLPRPWDSPGRNTGVGCHLRTANTLKHILYFQHSVVKNFFLLFPSFSFSKPPSLSKAAICHLGKHE